MIHIDVDLMKNIAFEKRSTIRRFAKGLQVSRSVVGRWVKDGLIRSHTNAIKPKLTDKNKLQRINFSLDALTLDISSESDLRTSRCSKSYNKVFGTIVSESKCPKNVHPTGTRVGIIHHNRRAFVVGVRLGIRNNKTHHLGVEDESPTMTTTIYSLEGSVSSD
ncbi:hypothetical protein ACS0TY_018552 [Phlomoides rotata]